MKRIIIILSFVLIVSGIKAMKMEDIRNAVRQDYLLSETDSPELRYVSEPDNEGKWDDIDYADESRSLWQLEKHLDRLVDMALLYERGNASDKKLYDAICRGLDQWFDGKYENPNWWYTKIGVPRRLLALAYILDSDLKEDHKNKIDKALDIIDSDDFPARPGGDRIQVLSNHAKVMLWRYDVESVKEILKKIEREARIAPFEEIMYDAGGSVAVRNDRRPSGRGVQKDMSFHHRGDRVDSTLTYGLELPEYFAYWALLLMDSDMAFNADAIHFIIDYYLDGVSRHLVAGKYAEPTILNRELSRPGTGTISSEIARKLSLISNGYRTDELDLAIQAVEKGGVPNGKYAADFGESAYFAFSRPEFQAGVRYHSLRNANQEAPHNSEGIRNHFRGDGACMISVTGREYADIYPVFDFRMIPGATTPMIPYEPLSEWGDVQVLNPPTQYAGAISDSIYGAVAFDFISPRVDLNARKGYFFFDKGFVCLGSGISSESPYEIVTTIQQCLSSDVEPVQENQTYRHNGITYKILDGEASAKIERRNGSWANCASDTEYENVHKEADVFSLYVSHGINPQNASYAYAVMPESNSVDGDFFRILRNDSVCQCVESTDDDLMYVIFYDKGKIMTPRGEFSSDLPCIMMIKDGTIKSVEL